MNSSKTNQCRTFPRTRERSTILLLHVATMIFLICGIPLWPETSSTPQIPGYVFEQWEYRGWYGTLKHPRWCPKQSKFGAREGKHKGVDIWMEGGTEVKAIVDGSIQWNPKGNDGNWGNHIFLNFTHNGKPYTYIYAHLTGLVGNDNRRVSEGEVIATSGCTGNANKCGEKNIRGGIQDHLHLELHDSNGPIDPVSWSGREVRYSDDSTCE